MTPAEKDAVMDRFRGGEIQVLVCTSVVEVGVDVPNATLMTIEGGQRFGLAQLHQLRGRISRGKFPGFCCVFADPQTEESQKRLKAFVASTDGFELAETDFQLRGPGDLFGTKQHGLPPLRIADLLRDADVLEEARRDAQALVAADPGLARPEHAQLAADDAGPLRQGAGVGRRGVSERMKEECGTRLAGGLARRSPRGRAEGGSVTCGVGTICCDGRQTAAGNDPRLE